MRKLILGIVAVFCVQITFQIFVAIDRAGADHRATNDAGPLVPPVVDRAGTAIDVAELSGNDGLERIDADMTGTGGVGESIVQRSRNIAPRTTAYDRTVRQPLNANRFSAAVAVVQPPRQLDLAAPLAPRDPGDAHLVTKEGSRAHTRSLFAKALSVVKKPYDLLKLVGSKLR